MCRRRHKTAYGRRQLQIGQQTALYLYKMHESTEDPRSTPLTVCLGFSFWTKQQSQGATDHVLNESWSEGTRLEFFRTGGAGSHLKARVMLKRAELHRTYSSYDGGGMIF